MNISYLQRVLILFSVVLLTSAADLPPCRAWSLAPQPTEGILVLRNGNILRGKIQKQGEHYHVHLPNGQLQVRERQVEMVCADLQEAYQRRRETRVGSSADSHLELAAWCIRHDLFELAEIELQEAASIDEHHRRLALLRRQLKHSMKFAKRNQEQVAIKKPIEPAPLDQKDLEKAPQWARKLFVRQIQPLMVHSCATGGCHQSGKDSSFQLNRLAVEGAGHPDLTLRNLSATLNQIDWQSADQSDLLSRAKRAHGKLSASTPLPPHKLKVLQTWIDQLAEAHQNQKHLHKLPAVTEVASLPQKPAPELIAPQQANVTPASEVLPAKYQTVDPFDPAVFNSSAEESVEEQELPSEPPSETELPTESTDSSATAPNE